MNMLNLSHDYFMYKSTLWATISRLRSDVEDIIEDYAEKEDKDMMTVFPFSYLTSLEDVRRGEGDSLVTVWKEHYPHSRERNWTIPLSYFDMTQGDLKDAVILEMRRNRK